MSDNKIFVGIRPIRRGLRSATQDQTGPKCQWEGCESPGIHRAPVGGAADGLYLMFCAGHSKQYREGYHYSPGKSDPVVARYQLDAAGGRIPSRGVRTSHQALETPLPSPIPSGSAKSLKARGKAVQSAGIIPVRKLKPLEAQALDVLALPRGATSDDIRRRYKERVKLDHPDANSGDRQSEDRLMATINAYRILKASGLC
ncbi:J domain-containing protein [Rhizobium sp. SIMBA_035]